MSKIVIRIGNTVRDNMITPAFAVDVEERKHADEKRLRVRIENEHQRLCGILREGLADMLVDKSAMSYTGAKVIIEVKTKYASRTDPMDGKCRVDVQFKDSCPVEFRDGAYRIYNSIRNSPRIAAAVAEEQRRQREELAVKRYECERRHGDLCSPICPDCPCYANGKCKEVLNG